MSGEDFDVRFDPNQLQSLLQSPDGPMAKSLERMGIQVEHGAKDRCPVDTGRLRSSITHQMGRDAQGLYVAVGSDVEYCPFVELGTSRMQAQPFLVPAVQDLQNGTTSP